MKAAELRDLGADELGAKERDLTDQLFRMRIQKSMGQLEAPDKMRTVRRDLARVKTVLRQKADRRKADYGSESLKKSASSSATRCRRASSSPSSGRCGTASTARPSGGRRSSWCTTRTNDAKIGDTRRDRRDAAAEPPQALGARRASCAGGKV